MATCVTCGSHFKPSIANGHDLFYCENCAGFEEEIDPELELEKNLLVNKSARTPPVFEDELDYYNLKKDE